MATSRQKGKVVVWLREELALGVADKCRKIGLKSNPFERKLVSLLLMEIATSSLINEGFAPEELQEILREMIKLSFEEKISDMN